MLHGVHPESNPVQNQLNSFDVKRGDLAYKVSCHTIGQDEEREDRYTIDGEDSQIATNLHDFEVLSFFSRGALY